jgi:hypothetical protein
LRELDEAGQPQSLLFYGLSGRAKSFKRATLFGLSPFSTVSLVDAYQKGLCRGGCNVAGEVLDTQREGA